MQHANGLANRIPVGGEAQRKSLVLLLFTVGTSVCRLQAEARLLAELDALKREQQADGARIKQEVRRGANVTAVRCGAVRTHSLWHSTAQHSTAQHSTAAPTDRPTDQSTDGTNKRECAVLCGAVRCHCAHRAALHCTDHTRNPSILNAATLAIVGSTSAHTGGLRRRVEWRGRS